MRRISENVLRKVSATVKTSVELSQEFHGSVLPTLHVFSFLARFSLLIGRNNNTANTMLFLSHLARIFAAPQGLLFLLLDGACREKSKIRFKTQD